MSQTPHPLDEFAKALTEQTITRRKAITTLAGAMVTGAYLNGPYRIGGRYLLGPAAADAPTVGPICDALKLINCLAKCATVATACWAEIAHTADVSCLGEVDDACNECDDLEACECPDDTSPCGPLGTLGGGWTCCEAGETCFPPGICQGPCDPKKCETVTIVGCLGCEAHYGTNYMCCDGVCTNTEQDPDNCGSCGNLCPPGAFCYATTTGGTCYCNTPEIICDYQCIVPDDPNNCGSCDNACSHSDPCCPPGVCCTDLPGGVTTGGVCCTNTDGDPYCCPSGTTDCCGGQCCNSSQKCCNQDGAQWCCAAESSDGCAGSMCCGGSNGFACCSPLNQTCDNSVGVCGGGGYPCNVS